MALQGQSFFEASGDGDAWAQNPISNAPWLADDPYVTSVGGTSLTLNGSGASYALETVWNYGFSPPGWAGSEYVGSGGGISTHYSIPSWQTDLVMSANRGSLHYRNFPDVAMPAANYVVVYQGQRATGWGGHEFRGSTVGGVHSPGQSGGSSQWSATGRVSQSCALCPGPECSLHQLFS